MIRWDQGDSMDSTRTSSGSGVNSCEKVDERDFLVSFKWTAGLQAVQ